MHQNYVGNYLGLVIRVPRNPDVSSLQIPRQTEVLGFGAWAKGPYPDPKPSLAASIS